MERLLKEGREQGARLCRFCRRGADEDSRGFENQSEPKMRVVIMRLLPLSFGIYLLKKKKKENGALGNNENPGGFSRIGEVCEKK